MEDNEILEEVSSALNADTYEKNISYVDIEKIYPNPNQPRKTFNDKALEDLSSSIKRHGVISPIILSPDGEKFMIIAGERRYRASKLAGIKKVPAIVRNYTEKQVKEIAIIENLQREDLNPIETAKAIRQFMQDYNMTQEEVADRLGKSRPTIANTLRLLNLSPSVISFIEENKLNAGHARSLLPLDSKNQLKVAKLIIDKGLSVRDTERRVKMLLNSPSEDEIKKRKQVKESISLELRELVHKMQRVFSTKVTAIGNDNKGRIYVDYFTRDDLDRMTEIIDKMDR